MTRTRCDRTQAWGELCAEFDARGRAFNLSDAFAADAGRFDAFSQSAPHVFADLSKNLLDARTQQLLFNLARQCGVEQHRDAMFAGAAINNTELRPVMHWLLRKPPLAGVINSPTQSISIANQQLIDASPLVHGTLDAMLA